MKRSSPNAIVMQAADGLNEWAIPDSNRFPQPPILQQVAKNRQPRAAQNPAQLAAQNGPIDPDLMAVVNAWPTLPETIRRQIAATIREAVGSHGVGDGGAR